MKQTYPTQLFTISMRTAEASLTWLTFSMPSEGKQDSSTFTLWMWALLRTRNISVFFFLHVYVRCGVCTLLCTGLVQIQCQQSSSDFKLRNFDLKKIIKVLHNAKFWNNSMLPIKMILNGSSFRSWGNWTETVIWVLATRCLHAGRKGISARRGAQGMKGHCGS